MSLDHGVPKHLGVKKHFVIRGTQKDVTERRTRYELREHKNRAHILEGLKIALDHIDGVIR